MHYVIHSLDVQWGARLRGEVERWRGGEVSTCTGGWVDMWLVGWLVYVVRGSVFDV